MLVGKKLLFFRQRAGKLPAKTGAHNFGFTLNLTHNLKFSVQSFAFWGKNFLTKINLYNKPKSAYENLFLSTNCTAFLFCILKTGYLL